MNEVGSSSAAARRAPLPPPKREEDEMLPLEGYDAAAFYEAIGEEDFVDDAVIEQVTAMMLQRSQREEAEQRKHVCRDEEINEILLEQEVAGERELREKKEEWPRKAEKQAAIYMDLVSNSE